MKHMPIPLLKKMLATGVIGLGCMGFGIAFYISKIDRIMLVLSLSLFVLCIYKAISLYGTSAKKQYEVVEGTCISISQKFFGKLQTVKMMDADGIECTVKLSKNCRFKIGNKYRLYFSQHHKFQTGNLYLDSALSTENLLAYEEL